MLNSKHDYPAGAMLFVLSYGLLIHSLPLVTGCIQGLIYAAVIIGHYYRYRKHG